MICKIIFPYFCIIYYKCIYLYIKSFLMILELYLIVCARLYHGLCLFTHVYIIACVYLASLQPLAIITILLAINNEQGKF